jgi:integrase
MPTYVMDTVPLWVDYMAAQGLSDRYVRLQRSAIAGPERGFLGVVQTLKGPRPTTGQIDHLCVDKFLAAHRGGLGSRTNKIQSLRHYLSWLETRGLLRPGLTAAKLLTGYKAKREQRRPKYYIPVEDFPSMLSVAHDPRDRAVLALALYTLARQSEIAALRLGGLPAGDDKVLRIYREKRKRWTDSPMGRELRGELDIWLKAYADHEGYTDWRQMAAEHPDWYLVPAKWSGQHGWHLRPDERIDRMESIAKLALTDLGVVSTTAGASVEHLGEGMHTVRRSGARALFARLVKSAGYESALTFTQSMLDHETQEMTLRYIGMDWVREQLNEWIIANGMYE